MAPVSFAVVGHMGSRAHGPRGWELTSNNPLQPPHEHLSRKGGQLPLAEQQRSRWVPFICCFASHFQHTVLGVQI